MDRLDQHITGNYGEDSVSDDEQLNTLDTAVMETLVRNFFEGDDGDEWADTILQEVRAVKTFAEASILTRDNGLVVTFRNGQAFQITIVQS